ncbi:MAG: helix-turn-helix domain-containing protein [Prevotellaceae bacterium]|nr:helix-turn-helix domain-containing protein [Prevotellaceae bacterium]
MEKKITQLTWKDNFKDNFNPVSIEDDFLLFDKINILPAFYQPFKSDMTTFMICTKGEMRGKINLKPHSTAVPCIITILADKILQYEYVSKDFEGLFIVMSKRFTEGLFPVIQERLPLLLSVDNTPFTSLTAEELELFRTYYFMLKTVVEMRENPHRNEMVKHLTLTFFYMSHSKVHEKSEMPVQTPCAILVDNFLKLAEKHYKTVKQVGFYAEKLCLTPKYLSRIIKQNTGKSANEWLDDYVMLEAKALLKSTNMTIQQISDYLNFPSQSCFGKYFKRVEGISPREYKKK